MTYEDEYDVLETVIFTIRDPDTEPEAELSWSQGSFTGYTMIDFNQWKPPLSNPHGASIHYGCVEGGILINPITGMIGLTQDNSHIVPQTGTYHIYAVHDLDANFKYDSVMYTLNVEQGVNVTLQKNIDEGGSAVFPDRTDVSTLTYTYLSNPIYAKVAHGYTVRVKAEPAMGYHFSGWYAGNDAAGYTPVSTNATFTYMDGNTELNVDTFYYHQPIAEYTTSKEEQYFIGWNPDVPSLMPAENLIVNARWNLVCDSLQDIYALLFTSLIFQVS